MDFIYPVSEATSRKAHMLHYLSNPTSVCRLSGNMGIKNSETLIKIIKMK